MLPIKLWPLHIIIISILLTNIALIGRVEAIDCFKCVSYNGANRACDDPFHNNYSTTILESPCMGGRKGRNGLFPATACIKIAGYYDDTGETITIRGCALDSGTLTTDTEIIRMSHCGKFYYDDRYVHGCLQSCSDADACNTAALSTITIYTAITAFIAIVINDLLHTSTAYISITALLVETVPLNLTAILLLIQAKWQLIR